MFRRVLTFLAAFAFVVMMASGAQAQGGTKRVALVIQLPTGVHTEIVTVPVSATTAKVLFVAKAHVDLASYPWGQAVCSINGVGNPLDDCFADPDEFWAYFHLTGGAWASSAVGVSDYVPTDGAVEGFTWSGMDASFNPTVTPPIKTFAEIEAELTPPPPAEIPEPATILLLSAGLTGLAAYKRRSASSRK